MATFTVHGTVDMGRGTQVFEHEIDAESKTHAQQQVYAKYGSEHGANKSQITITAVEEA